MPPAAAAGAPVIGKGMALLLGSIIGAKVGTDIYATRKAGQQNTKALEAGERSDTRASEIERERLAEERRALDVQIAEKKRADDEARKFEREEAARKKAQYDAAVAMNAQQWQDYLRINEPHWRQGAGVLGSLYDIAGAGSAPAYAAPTQPAPMSAGAGGGQSLPDIMTSGPTSRPQVEPRRGTTFPTMPMPKSSGMSLDQLMQLAAAGGSKMPTPTAAAPYYVGTEA